MAITNFDQWINSAKQRLALLKTASRTTIAGLPFSVFDLAGLPSGGVLAGANTANGIVPTSSVAGFSPIRAFEAGSLGYITSASFASTVASRINVFDCLFKAGAYSFNSNVVLTSQPSYSSRVPLGTDYSGTELWLEGVTAFTGNLTITVTYTNQSGVTGRTTGAVATGVAPTVGRMILIPLASGDRGIQRIESVVASVSTAGTFNLLVLRRLVSGRIRSANDGVLQGITDTGMVQVFDTSALFLQISADGTSSGIPEVILDISSG